MTFVLAAIHDDCFEDSPIMCIGVSLDQVAEAVIEYLRISRPQLEDGSRAEIGPVTFDSCFSWLIKNRDEFPDITVDLFMAGVDPRRRVSPSDGIQELLVPATLLAWARDHGPDLFRSHTPLAQRRPR